MTNKEAIARIKDHMIIHEIKEPRAIYISEALKKAIKALEQQPCEDCISRKLLSDNICEGISCNECSFNEIDGESGCLLQKRLDELPSVQPKPKTDVLDKIRAEIHATAEMHEDGNYYLRDEWIDEIFDNYKAESEE